MNFLRGYKITYKQTNGFPNSGCTHSAEALVLEGFVIPEEIWEPAQTSASAYVHFSSRWQIHAFRTLHQNPDAAINDGHQ